MANDAGKQFEKDIQDSANKYKNMYIYRLRDSANAWNPTQNDNIRFTPTNICDFVLVEDDSPLTLFLEMKTTKNTSLPYSMLKKNQIDGLKNISDLNFKHLKGGFIFNFRKYETTFYLSGAQICEYMKLSEQEGFKYNKKSFSYEWVKDNGLEIKGIIKRVHYRYVLDEFVKDLVKTTEE